MAVYILTTTRQAAYAKLFDFRTQIVRAARQILTVGGIEAVGPGEGVQAVPRYYTSVDFLRGSATGRKVPVALGDRRYYEYGQYLGTLSILNTVPTETDPKTGGAYLTEDHVRVLDELTSQEHTLFMEHLEPFTATLPWLDMQEIMPIDPDERPISEREVNAAFMRWRLKFEVRYEAWPVVA